MNEKKIPKIIPIRGWNVGQRYVTKCILLDVINKHSVSLPLSIECVCVCISFRYCFIRQCIFVGHTSFRCFDRHARHSQLNFHFEIINIWLTYYTVYSLEFHRLHIFTEMRIIRTGVPCKYSWKWLNIIIFITMN